jgi:hypothetical protein
LGATSGAGTANPSENQTYKLYKAEYKTWTIFLGMEYCIGFSMQKMEGNGEINK